MHINNTPKAAPTSSPKTKTGKRLRIRSEVKAGGSASWGNTGGSHWWGFGGGSAENT